MTLSIPTKRSISPEYDALLDRHAALQTESRGLRAEAAPIIARLSTGDGKTGQEARVATLLGDPQVEAQSDIERLAAIRSRLGDLDAAIEMLASRISVESTRASRMVIEVVAEEHNRLVAVLCETLIAAHHANKNFHRLCDALNDDGVQRGHLRAMQPNSILGQPDDSYSNIAIYLREAVEYGFIPRDAVPSEFTL